VNLTEPLGQARTIEVAAGPLRVYERGQGEPILFVHGLFANAVAWRKVVPALAESFQCITADWPFGSHSLPMEPEAGRYVTIPASRTYVAEDQPARTAELIAAFIADTRSR
jgi:pimeloyl-ACP methyl ester carboxylesterase